MTVDQVIQLALGATTILGALWAASLKYQEAQNKKEAELLKEQTRSAANDAAAKLAAQQLAHQHELALHKDLSTRFSELKDMILNVDRKVDMVATRLDALATRQGALEATCNMHHKEK